MAGDASRENGKKGGRKKGLASIKAEQARALLAQMVFDEITPLGQKLIEKAKKGDVQAFKELFDRAFGKAPQHIDLGNKDGSLKTIVVQKADVNSNNTTTT